jgi:AcrR family transcriptional regulator
VASKEDVLWSIVLRAADRFDAAVAPIAADSSASPSVRLARMISAHIGVIAVDLGNASSFLQEWRFLSPDRRRTIADRRDRYEARFRAVLEEGIAATEFDSSLEPHLAATLILSALNGVAAWYRPTGSLTPAQIADRYTSMLLGGLRQRSASIYPDADAAMRTLR